MVEKLMSKSYYVTRTFQGGEKVTSWFYRLNPAISFALGCSSFGLAKSVVIGRGIEERY